jgi:hypothetical protein
MTAKGKYMSKLEGKVAVVTGGNSGIGLPPAIIPPTNNITILSMNSTSATVVLPLCNQTTTTAAIPGLEPIPGIALQFQLVGV